MSHFMRSVSLVVGLFLAMAVTARAATPTSDDSWSAIDRRPVPAWFGDAKFGIFIHWGVYSVPAWGPKGKYAEWYWRELNKPGSETAAFHASMYGPKVRYPDFAADFKAELFDPVQWADLFRRSGARYVVLTSKHHDGFALWPSAQSWNWNSVDVGPHRDLAGDLAQAVRAQGLKMGFYYSLYEWYHPLFKKESIGRYVDEHMMPQIKDLVTRYHPSVLWTDGEWDHPSAVWKSTEFLTWLFTLSPVRDEIVINDRWGSETRSHHGGFYTSEYGNVKTRDLLTPAAHPWEEDRGIGASFGYSRRELLDEYATPRDLIHLLVRTVSRGGNLLLDIGPTADGRIPVIMQERLQQVGAWLTQNGAAIYGTRPWRQAAEPESQGVSPVHYTWKDGTLYAISMRWPGRELRLTAPRAAGKLVVTLLGHPGTLRARQQKGQVVIEIPPLGIDDIPGQHAYVFALSGVQ